MSLKSNDNRFEKVFKKAEETDLADLEKIAFDERDKDKQAVLLAIYQYALGKRQKEVVGRKRFVR